MRVWVHPTREQLETGFTAKSRHEILVRKLRDRVLIEKFAPVEAYHAVVLVCGVRWAHSYASQRTALRLLSETPLGFADTLSQTWHLVGGGRPMIGLIASDRPLDRLETFAHFTDCGVAPDASG